MHFLGLFRRAALDAGLDANQPDLHQLLEHVGPQHRRDEQALEGDPAAAGVLLEELVHPLRPEGEAGVVVDLDARVSLEFIGLNDKTYFQLNVSNLFDKLYVGGFSGGAIATNNIPNVQIGSPRTVMGSLTIGF